MNQLYAYIYLIPLWPPYSLRAIHLGHHRAPSYIPCAIWQIATRYFTHGSVFMSISWFTKPLPSHPVHKSLLYIFISIHSYVDEHLGCVHILVIVNTAAIKFRVHESFWIIFLSGHMHNNGTAGLYGGSIFRFLSSHHTVLHSDCISLHSYQPFWSVWGDTSF